MISTVTVSVDGVRKDCRVYHSESAARTAAAQLRGVWGRRSKNVEVEVAVAPDEAFVPIPRGTVYVVEDTRTGSFKIYKTEQGARNACHSWRGIVLPHLRI